MDNPSSENYIDFSARMRAVCTDMTTRIAALRHIKMERVGVGFRQTHGKTDYGVLAHVAPLRFENGSLTTIRNGREYRMAPVYGENHVEYLYIINFYLPRYLMQTLDMKLITIVHELMHINEKFNGDIRRFEGRCYAHSSSHKNYDAYAKRLASLWLALDPPKDMYAFLRLTYPEFSQKYKSIRGYRFGSPRLIPVDR